MKLDKYASIRLKNSLSFAVNRIRKYYPLYIVTMIAFFPLSIIRIKSGELGVFTFIVQIVSSIFMVRSWIPIRAIASSLNEVAWFLCLYFFLLIVTPLFGKIVRRMKLRWKGIIAFILILYVIEILNTCLVHNFNNAYWLVYMNPVIRSLDYLIGMCLGRLSIMYIHVQERIAKIILFISIFISIFICANMQRIPSPFGLTIPWTLLSGGLVMAVASGNLCKFIFENKYLVVIGNNCLEIFLIHYPIICYLKKIDVVNRMFRLEKVLLYAFASFVCIILWKKINVEKVKSQKKFRR